jgi:integrase
VRKLGLLSGFFSWCEREQGWIEANPVRRVSKPRLSDARDRTITDEEIRYLVDAARGSRAGWLAQVVVVLSRSAMRRSELWSLKAGDVDYDASTVHLPDSKNGCARSVPLCPEAREALGQLEASANRRKEVRLVPVADPAAVSLAFRRAVVRAKATYVAQCRAAGRDADPGFLSGVRLHDLRHTAISHWAGTGGLSTMELMAISGHKTPRMLARYTHLKSTDLAKRLAQLAPARMVASPFIGSAADEQAVQGTSAWSAG